MSPLGLLASPVWPTCAVSATATNWSLRRGPGGFQTCLQTLVAAPSPGMLFSRSLLLLPALALEPSEEPLSPTELSRRNSAGRLPQRLLGAHQSQLCYAPVAEGKRLHPVWIWGVEKPFPPGIGIAG